MKVDPRTKLLSYFAGRVGGWNASPGQHAGRLRDEEYGYSDDEKIVDTLLDTHKRDVTRPLIEENTQLKAKIYDLRVMLRDVTNAITSPSVREHIEGRLLELEKTS